VLVRQVLGAIAQFEKASLVAKPPCASLEAPQHAGGAGGGKPRSDVGPGQAARAGMMIPAPPPCASLEAPPFMRAGRVVESHAAPHLSFR
jgi:hypothetical protein